MAQACFGLALLPSSCINTGSSVDCPVGSESCPCTDGGSCDEGLYCAPSSQVCVNRTGGGSAGNTGTAGKSGNSKAGSGPGTIPDPTREEGPDVESPYTPDIDAVLTLNEELGNPLNQANGVSVPWWLPATFRTKGGLLSVGGQPTRHLLRPRRRGGSA